MTEVKTYKQFINGEWVTSDSGKTIEVFSPSTEEVVGYVQDGTVADAESALQAAKKAQLEWRQIPSLTRAKYIKRFSNEIKANRDYLAELLVKEQGKLLKVAYAEVDVTSTFLEYASEWAHHIEGDIVQSDNKDEHIYIHKIPKGVVVAITAWNFPLALAGRKIGPALMAGNSVIVKPPLETPLATMELGNCAKKAGIPDGVLNIINGDGPNVGSYLVSNPITNMVTMTGSTPTGQAIVRGAARNLATVQLELGGKAPFIVMEDADLEAAADAALHSRFDNCGQICTCNERLYLHEDIYDDFMKIFMEKVENYKVGDPMHPDSDMGPKINGRELEHMEKMVSQAVEEGATVAFGGKRPEGEQFKTGFWFEPTVLTNVKQNMTIVHEETFGPILPVIKFSSFEQAIEYANDSIYGLAAMVFTNDMKKILRLNLELEYGEIYINRGHGEQHQGFHNGYKLSGSGGEDGKYGFEQYLEKKTFYMNFK